MIALSRQGRKGKFAKSGFLSGACKPRLQTICFPYIFGSDSCAGAGASAGAGSFAAGTGGKGGCCYEAHLFQSNWGQQAMPKHGSIRLSPIDWRAREPARGSALPPAVLIALESSEGAEQSLAAPAEAAPPEQEAAIFSQDESHPVPASFVADATFDSEEADGTADWPSAED